MGATLKKITAEKRALGKTASKANGKKMAAAMKKAGKGIFAPKKLSDSLAAVCGAKTLPRTEVTKKVWVYIKKHGLNNGRTIKPDATLKAIFPVPSFEALPKASTCSRWPGTSASTWPETLGEPRPFSRRVPTSRRALESRSQELRSCIPRLAARSLFLT